MRKHGFAEGPVSVLLPGAGRPWRAHAAMSGAFGLRCLRAGWPRGLAQQELPIHPVRRPSLRELNSRPKLQGPG